MPRLTAGPKAMPDAVGRVLLGLLPLWILFELIAFPGSTDRFTAYQPSVAGLPAGIVLVGAALAVMAIGVVALRRAASYRSVLLAFLGLTVPAAAVVVVAPALILKRGRLAGSLVLESKHQTSDFYRSIVQGLRAWAPAAPRLPAPAATTPVASAMPPPFTSGDREFGEADEPKG